MKINQYQIVIVNLDPTTGSEIKKTRPCVVISPDEMNHYLNTIVIAPITTTSKNYPTRVKMKSNNETNWIAVDQIRTIDRKRIVKSIGKITNSEITLLKEVIKETFVL